MASNLQCQQKRPASRRVSFSPSAFVSSATHRTDTVRAVRFSEEDNSSEAHAYAPEDHPALSSQRAFAAARLLQTSAGFSKGPSSCKTSTKFPKASQQGCVLTEEWEGRRDKYFGCPQGTPRRERRNSTGMSDRFQLREV